MCAIERRVGRREKKRMVMSKRLKELAGEAAENRLATTIRESANQIGLAGLGAFSMARQEGSKMFEALVAEGEKAQERAKVAADERLTELRERANGTWDKLEKVFEDRVARALHALNVPSRHDIDTLSKRVHELTAITKKLPEEEETRGAGRAHRARAA
jgi:poly(hydroxyalkanoate) granule-associated protein